MDMAEACKLFGTPITGGNVSFYNETLGRGIMPTPVIGMVGLLDDMAHLTGTAFREPGHVVLLLGETREELGASEYLELVHGRKAGPVPELDLENEFNLQGACREIILAGSGRLLSRLRRGRADGGSGRMLFCQSRPRDGGGNRDGFGFSRRCAAFRRDPEPDRDLGR